MERVAYLHGEPKYLVHYRSEMEEAKTEWFDERLISSVKPADSLGSNFKFKLGSMVRVCGTAQIGRVDAQRDSLVAENSYLVRVVPFEGLPQNLWQYESDLEQAQG